jgi:hypothetical protein
MKTNQKYKKIKKNKLKIEKEIEIEIFEKLKFKYLRNQFILFLINLKILFL